MSLFRVHAFAVEPQRTANTPLLPAGGNVPITPDLRDALAAAAQQSDLESRILVDFRVDTTTRTNEVRDLLLQFAFGSASEARAAASSFAQRLSQAMDFRSSACLFVLAGERDGNRRRVSLWTFPRDEAFQFRSGQGQVSIRLLTDVFSRTSHLRKAALFEGENRRTDFLRGRALDFQANQVTREVADFWIRRFLDCMFAIAGEAGTRMLAQCLRRTWEAVQDQSERDQLHAGIVAVRSSPQGRWSLREFADRHLHGLAKETFLAAAPNPEALESPFDLVREVFDKTINFRIFGLDTGVYVSAPFGEVGRSVRVDDQRLSCEGTVVKERVSSRHA